MIGARSANPLQGSRATWTGRWRRTDELTIETDITLPALEQNVAMPVSTPPRDMRNRALASLPDADFELLRPHLRNIRLIKNETLHRQEDHVNSVCFPLQGMISNIIRVEDGRSIESAMTGPEGMSNFAALGSGISAGDWLVQGDGEAVTLDVDHLFGAMQTSPRISRMICLAAEASHAYTLQSFACLAFHDVEERVCRWILMARYHANSDELVLTQEFLGFMLGVQRTSVTLVAGKLQNDGLISYHRGLISVLDVSGLEKRACECYKRMSVQLDAMFPRGASVG
ncbi:Crp/Fnr family transcriptional regulator [Methylopila sp. M107]|uniref:Crp/Fnr family transcriptional regulator n=1 Tax=Methylopila sp. M107 TaxID=1101190 RepID=UPI00039FD98F|nr:Crp/Fnr family transcriptional regulator [Methylopila sp. M107]